MNWKHIDTQMRDFSARLQSEVKLSSEMTNKLATTISSEVRFLSLKQKEQIKESSPVSLTDRLDELKAFQNWMDQAHSISINPSVTRAQIITQNYVCFVYLPESCFRILYKICPKGTATKKCAQFLINNPIRAFRNAVAHANWAYRSDYKAIVYWARKGNDMSEPLTRFEVEENDLSFWQALSRCVAYAAYSNL